MKSFLLVIAFSSLLFSVFAEDHQYEEFRVRIYHSDNNYIKSLDKLVENGIFMLDHPKVDSEFVDAYVSRRDFSTLESLGYRFEEIEHPGRTAAEKRSSSSGIGGYTHYDNMTDFLQTMANNHPGIARWFTIGKSVEGREIQGIRITKNPGVRENEPEVKYVANIHGDETVGRELMVYFIEELLTNYNAIPFTPLAQRITKLIDNTDIYIIPSMNPDGFERGYRANRYGLDLNRNFPDIRFAGRETGIIQKETKAMMDFIDAHHFVLSVSYHGGSVCVNYPYDGNQNRWSGVPDYTPDNDIFEHISLVYSRAHANMYQSTEFNNGITNGAGWYVLYGGMQDWNYLNSGCLEVTIELSNIKYPSAKDLPTYWNDNKESMLSFLEQTHIGVRGVVTDALTNLPLSATIRVSGNPLLLETDPAHGNYNKLLVPGDYTLMAEAEGYEPKVLTVTVPPSQLPYQAVELNFALNPVTSA